MGRKPAPHDPRHPDGRFASMSPDDAEDDPLPPRVRDSEGRFKPSQIPARDDKGHSVTVATAITHDMASVIDRVLTAALVNGEYPWRTKSEALRWLIAAGLEQLDLARDEAADTLARIKVDRHVQHLEDMRRWVAGMEIKIVKEIDDLMRQDIMEASDNLQNVLANLDAINDSVQIGRLKEMLVKRYPALLKKVPTFRPIRHSVHTEVPLLMGTDLPERRNAPERRKPLGSKKR